MKLTRSYRLHYPTKLTKLLYGVPASIHLCAPTFLLVSCTEQSEGHIVCAHVYLDRCGTPGSKRIELAMVAGCSVQKVSYTGYPEQNVELLPASLPNNVDLRDPDWVDMIWQKVPSSPVTRNSLTRRFVRYASDFISCKREHRRNETQL